MLLDQRKVPSEAFVNQPNLLGNYSFKSRTCPQGISGNSFANISNLISLIKKEIALKIDLQI
jgi:hypothetical protein